MKRNMIKGALSSPPTLGVKCSRIIEQVQQAPFLFEEWNLKVESFKVASSIPKYS